MTGFSVLDEEYRLICFAYEDVDANREIRMLRELSEHSEALQFSDLYPEYQCVRIYEFNELAYFFAKYLESQNISVQVQGEMWRNFFAGKECEVPEYACLTVYAEGVAGKSRIFWKIFCRVFRWSLNVLIRFMKQISRKVFFVMQRKAGRNLQNA